jgi:hypothetical protein
LKAQNFFPLFSNGKNADADILYLPRERKRMKIFRLAKFLSKNDFFHKWGTGFKSKELFAVMR